MALFTDLIVILGNLVFSNSLRGLTFPSTMMYARLYNITYVSRGLVPIVFCVAKFLSGCLSYYLQESKKIYILGCISVILGSAVYCFGHGFSALLIASFLFALASNSVVIIRSHIFNGIKSCEYTLCLGYLTSLQLITSFVAPIIGSMLLEIGIRSNNARFLNTITEPSILIILFSAIGASGFLAFFFRMEDFDIGFKRRNSMLYLTKSSIYKQIYMQPSVNAHNHLVESGTNTDEPVVAQRGLWYGLLALVAMKVAVGLFETVALQVAVAQCGWSVTEVGYFLALSGVAAVVPLICVPNLMPVANNRSTASVAARLLLLAVATLPGAALLPTKMAASVLSMSIPLMYTVAFPLAYVGLICDLARLYGSESLSQQKNTQSLVLMAEAVGSMLVPVAGQCLSGLYILSTGSFLASLLMVFFLNRQQHNENHSSNHKKLTTCY